MDPYSLEVISPPLYTITLILISWQFSKEDEECQRFLKDTTIQSLIKNAKYLKEVSFDDYSALFYVGGHGPVFDLAKDEVNISLANKVRLSIVFEDLSLKSPIVLPCREGYRCCMPWPCVSTTCRFTAPMTSDRRGLQSAIIGVTGEDGKSIFDGNAATCFSNDEEKEIGWDEVSRPVSSKTGYHNEVFQDVPYLLEDRIKSLGGKYEKADKKWGVRIDFCSFFRCSTEIFSQIKVVHSGNVFTGQNPASARQLAQEMLDTLQGKAKSVRASEGLGNL